MGSGIDLVRADHKKINELFELFNATLDGALIEQAIEALRTRDDAEHAAFYALASRILDDPALMQRLGAARAAVTKQIDVVAALKGARLIDAFETLQVFVREHARVEETKLLPRLAEVATTWQLEGLPPPSMAVKQPA